MKPMFKKIIISFAFSIVGVCWLLFVLFKLDGDWLLSWAGVLMAYLSLFTVIRLYNRETYDSKFAKVLVKTIITSFNFGIIGISFGIVYQMLGRFSLNLMAGYWLLMLFLYLITIISLIILVFVNHDEQNDQNDTILYRNLILLTLLFTVWPVLWPVLLTIIGNGMNASAG